MASMAELQGIVAQQAQQEKQAALDLQGLFFAMGQNASEAAAAKENGTVGFNGRQETVESAKQRMQADLIRQNDVRALADSIDYKALSFSLLDETNTTIAKQRELATKIETDASVSLWDDPLTALANAFTLPWDQQALEATNSKLKLLSDAQDKVATQINRFSETADKTKESLTQASIDSIATGLLQDQRAVVLEAHNKALHLNAQGVEAVSRMNHQQLQTLTAGYNILAQEENRQYMREQRQAALEERNKIREDKEKGKLLILEDVGFVKDAMAREFGKVNFTDDEIRRALERKDPMMSHLRDKGVTRRLQGFASDGESPEERYNYWAASGKKATTGGQERLQELTIQALKDPSVVAIKDKTAKAAAAQALVRAKMDQWEGDVGSGDKNNPLSLPAFKSLENTAAITANPAYIAIKDVVQSPTHKDLPIDMQLVYGNLIEGVARGQIRYADSVKLLESLGSSYRATIGNINKVHELTNEFQKHAVVHVKPGSALGDTMVAAAPVIAAGIVAPGPWGPFALAGSAATAGAGYMMTNRRMPLDLLDGTSIRTAFNAGLAARLQESKIETGTGTGTGAK